MEAITLRISAFVAPLALADGSTGYSQALWAVVRVGWGI